jgi:hypothetical protein
MVEKSFREYDKLDRANWITLASGNYYPDILPRACHLYTPVLEQFGALIDQSASSQELFRLIQDENQWMRTQLCRVFRKYVSPTIPVEMLKRKNQVEHVIKDFGATFRPINEVQAEFSKRPIPDEALCAILFEYHDRGSKGYDLAEQFFALTDEHLGTLKVSGPKRAGKDILLGDVFKTYPKPDRPVDFIIQDKKKKVLAVGLTRYDSDRGGSQEDDRPGQYREVAEEIIFYGDRHGLPHLKVVFINDGPGLLLGTMWEDYSRIEDRWNDRVRVMTLRMIQTRLTEDWLYY